MDKRVYTKVEGFEAEVDLGLVLTEEGCVECSYGVALMLEGPLAGYEVILSPYSLNKLRGQWEEQDD